MAKNKVNTLDVAKGDDRFDRLDTALGKFSKSGRRGSIIKSAQQNVFEFPAFVSNTIPVDYATATVALLEQLYAAYLQIAVSINPFIDADTAKKGLQFANFKTNTNKYLEYTDTMYQHAICDPVYTEGDVRTSFELISVEDDTARLINEAMNYEPLSEFDHFWQEDALDPANATYAPEPLTDANGNVLVNGNGEILFKVDANGQLSYKPYPEIMASLVNKYTVKCDSDGKPMTRADGSPVYAMFDTGARGGKVGTLKTVAAGDAYGSQLRKSNLLYTAGDINKAKSDLANADLSAKRAALTQKQIDQLASSDASMNPSFRKGLSYANAGMGTLSNAVGLTNDTANAIKNVATLKDQIANEKLRREKAERDLENYERDKASQRTDTWSKLAGATKTEYVNDQACQKLNTMKPLLMKVGVNMLNKDDTVQPIQYIVGVKVFTRMVPSSILPEVAQYPLKEMNKISRKVKWRAGELKFFRDLVFRIKEKKQTAADSRDPNRKWYRRLYELAHMQGDAPSAAVVQGKSLFKTFIDERSGKGKLANGMIPNASIIMTQSDVDNIKSQTGIDLLKGSTAKKFCGELFLISLIIIDTDAQSIKIMLPDMNNDFDVHSIASVEKQLATLSTAGSKTREIFKLLG